MRPAALPPEHLQTCRNLLMPSSACERLQRAGALDCSQTRYRRSCAKVCGTCERLVVKMQVGLLMDGVLPIPENASSVLVEIGSSDRNTMDKEVLPKMPEAFLVTAEPLIEKYARALGRRRDRKEVIDSLEPLGQHHDRGFILPFAIAPGAGSGELRDLNVGGNSGCASLRAPNRRRHRGGGSFGGWCDRTGESDKSNEDPRSGARAVWSVPLRQLLRWIDRPVEFMKIDAQGLDLDIVASGGDQLHLVQRVALEVISDDCKPVYLDQPRCTAVMMHMAQLGFEPLTPMPCAPRFERHKANHFCELEVVFVNSRARVTAADTRGEWLRHHNGFLNWCDGLYDITIPKWHPVHEELGKSRLANVPRDSLLAAMQSVPGKAKAPAAARYYRVNHSAGLARKVAVEGAKASREASTERLPGLGHPGWGSRYLCPNTCAADRASVNRTHFFGVEWTSIYLKRKECPW